MNKANLKPIMLVVIIGVILGGLILGWDNSKSTGEVSAESVDSASTDSVEQKGPRGGWLFTEDGLGVEVIIYEKGTPSRFMVYLYEDNKPLPPTAAKVAITASRLGRAAELFQFRAEGDYLLSDLIVAEPHSFDLVVAAEWKGKTYRWNYSQVEARVEMSDALSERSGIVIKKAGPAMIKPVLQLPGQVVFNHHTIVKMMPRVAGFVIEVKRHLGETVKKGDVMAIIESQILAELRSQYLAARKRVQLANTTYAREKTLWEEKITAQQDFLAAQQLFNEARIELDLVAAKLHALGVKPEATGSEKNLAQYQILAPITGLVITQSIVLGQVVTENTEIFTVADISTMYADLIVYPKDLSVIKVGQSAIVKATASNAESGGVVSYVSTHIDPQTQAAKAHITLDNKSGQWQPGMFINIELNTEEIHVPVAVSTDAIQTFRDWSVVFGRYGQYFEARPLTLGRSDGELVEVLDGLVAGESYAAGNSFAIKAELGKFGASHDH